jgi:hypothetical protein
MYIFCVVVKGYNKAKQHQSLRSLDSLALAPFVHGFAMFAQSSQSQVCRCWRRYRDLYGCLLVQA